MILARGEKFPWSALWLTVDAEYERGAGECCACDWWYAGISGA